jgi:hypothetical protein
MSTMQIVDKIYQGLNLISPWYVEESKTDNKLFAWMPPPP